ncbi:uncharacterized protein LOC120347875 isoform X3 [Styela clava]
MEDGEKDAEVNAESRGTEMRLNLVSKNTIVVKFEKNNWVHRKDVVNFIGQKIGKTNIASVYEEGEKIWIVTLHKENHVTILLKEGIPYQFQNEDFITYPMLYRNDVTKVEMSKTPYHLLHADITEMLQTYGECLNIQNFYDEDNIATGIRVIQIVLKKHLPRRINIPWHMGGGQFQMTYKSKPIIVGKHCYICTSNQHIANECPKRIPCDFCGMEGRPHLTKNCRRKTQQIYEQELRIASEVEKEKQKQEKNISIAKTNNESHEPDGEKTQQIVEIMDTQQQTEVEKIPQSPLSKEHKEENMELDQLEMDAITSLMKLRNESDIIENNIEGNQSKDGKPESQPKILLIGDSQVKRIKGVVSPQTVNAIHIPGGAFMHGEEWLNDKDPCVENLALYFGTNHLDDDIETFNHQVERIMKCANRSAINVYFMEIVPYKGSTKKKIDTSQINDIIKLAAKQLDILVVELPKKFRANDDSLYEKDGVHLSEEEAKLLAGKLLYEVQQHMTFKKRKMDNSPS